ncbi:hypothetical protein Tco_1448698 [Tanacetum coccineum]
MMDLRTLGSTSHDDSKKVALDHYRDALSVIYLIFINSRNFEILTVLDIVYHAILTVLDIVYHAILTVLDIVYHAILTVLDIVYHAILTVLDIVYHAILTVLNIVYHAILTVLDIGINKARGAHIHIYHTSSHNTLFSEHDEVCLGQNIKTAQDLEITNLKKRVKKLEKKKKLRTPQLKSRLFKGRNEIDQDEGISWFQEDVEIQGRYGHDVSTTKVTTASVPVDVDVSVASPTRPVDDSTTNDITLVETLTKIKSSASKSQKDKGVMFKEPSEPTITSRPQPQILTKDKGKGIMQEPEKLVKVKGKDQIEYDTDVAQRPQAELDEEARLEREREEEAQEREELTVKEQSKLLAEFIETRRKYFAVKRDEENINKPPTKTQQRSLICTYLKNMEGYKHKDFKGKSFDAIKKMFDKAYKRVNTFVAIDSKVVESSGKKDESSRKKAKSSGKEAVSKKRASKMLSEESVKIQKLEYDA